MPFFPISMHSVRIKPDVVDAFAAPGVGEATAPPGPSGSNPMNEFMPGIPPL
jgi:hypothetical protein